MRKVIISSLLGFSIFFIGNYSLHAEDYLNSGDTDIKRFVHRVYNNENWQYGTWTNDSSVDKVYGRMANLDYDTGDAHLLLQEKGTTGYFTACSKNYSNLAPGEYISCYNDEIDNSWDTFRTNVKWSKINNSDSDIYYIDTQIQGGYNIS